MQEKIKIRWGKDTPETEVHWLWKPYIPYGKLTLVQGDGGDGKTSLMLKIAAMLTTGTRPPEMRSGHLFEPETIEPETVFYASTEEEIADCALPRFRRNGGNDNHFAYSAERDRHMTLSEEDITSAIKSTGARMIIIDPVQAFLPKGVSMSNMSKMRPIFTALSNAALTTGAAVVLIGHLTKNESAKAIHRGFGSADIAAAVRSILMVSRDKNLPYSAPRMIECIKSNFDESDYSRIFFRLDDERKIELLDGNDYTPPTEEPELSPIDRAKTYLVHLLSSGPVESNEVKENLDAMEIAERTANRAKKELGIRSERKDGKSYWVMPEKTEEV